MQNLMSPILAEGMFTWWQGVLLLLLIVLIVVYFKMRNKQQ